MTDYTHDPRALALADGTTLANGATTGAAAGWVLTGVTSGGGTITISGNAWNCVAGAGVARLDGSIPGSTTVGFEVLLDITTLPTGSANRIIEVLNGSASVAKLEMNPTTGTVTLFNFANASVWTSSALGTGEVRIFIGITVNTTTAANGDVDVFIYKTNPRSSTTPDESYSPASFNAGTAVITRLRAGRLSSTAGSTASVKVLYERARDHAATPVGPLAFYTAPSFSINETDYYRVLVASPNLGGAPSASYSISHLSGPNNLGSVLEPTDGDFYIPQDATLPSSYRITMTTAGGTATNDVTVPPAAGVVLPTLVLETYDGSSWD